MFQTEETEHTEARKRTSGPFKARTHPDGEGKEGEGKESKWRLRRKAGARRAEQHWHAVGTQSR